MNYLNKCKKPFLFLLLFFLITFRVFAQNDCTGTDVSPCNECDASDMDFEIRAPDDVTTTGWQNLSYSSESGTCGTTPEITEAWHSSYGYTFCPQEGAYDARTRAYAEGEPGVYEWETSDWNLAVYDVNFDADQNWCNCNGSTWLSDPNWWNSNWNYRKKITFDNSGQSTNLTNFPVLVVLHSGNFDYAKAKSDGADIRFIDSDDSTSLDYEIEDWDPDGNSYIWVKVPQIDASSSTDFIYLYYGNSSASDGQNPTGVWDSDYKMVHHLDGGIQNLGAETGNSTGWREDNVAGNNVDISSAQKYSGTYSFHVSSTGADTSGGWWSQPFPCEEGEVIEGSVYALGSGTDPDIHFGMAYTDDESATERDSYNWFYSGTATTSWAKYSGTVTVPDLTPDVKYCKVWLYSYKLDGDVWWDNINVSNYSAAQDSTSNDRDGIHKGNSTGPVTYTSSGKIGGAIEFDNSDDWIQVDGDVGVTGAMTIEHWYYTTNQNSGGYFFDNRDPGSWWYIKNYTGGTCASYPGNICFEDRVWAESSEWSANQWQYIVVTDDTTTVRMYVNGVEVGTGTGEASTISTNLRYGTRYTNSNYLDGKMDEVRISSTARSADWIKATYLSESDQFNSFGNEETPGISGSNYYCCGDDGAEDNFSFVSGSVTTDTSVECSNCSNGLATGMQILYGNGYWSGTDPTTDTSGTCYYGDITCSAGSAANGASGTYYGNGYISGMTCYYGDITCTDGSASNGSNCTLGCSGVGTSCCPSTAIFRDSIACTESGCSQSDHDRDSSEFYCTLGTPDPVIDTFTSKGLIASSTDLNVVTSNGLIKLDLQQLSTDYNFETTANCKAFEKGGTTPSSPSDYDNVAESADYTALSANDNSRWETSLATAEAFDSQIYDFNISETLSSISSLQITWIGYGETQSGYDTNLFIWNRSSSQWEQLDSKDFTSASNSTLAGTITSSISDYVDSSTGRIVVMATTQKSKLQNGTSCSSAAQCLSGYCVDGVCCDTACNGTCQRCDSYDGTAGTCHLIANDHDPDNECSPGTASCANICTVTWSGDGACSGTSAACDNTTFHTYCGTHYVCSSGSCVSGQCGTASD